MAEPGDEWRVRLSASTLPPSTPDYSAFLPHGALDDQLTALRAGELHVETGDADGPIGVLLVRGSGVADTTDQDAWQLQIDGLRASASAEQPSANRTHELPAPLPLDKELTQIEDNPRPLVFGVRLEGEALAPARVELVVEQQLYTTRDDMPGIQEGDRTTTVLRRVPLVPHRSTDAVARTEVMPYPFAAASPSSLSIISFREQKRYAERVEAIAARNQAAEELYKEQLEAWTEKEAEHRQDVADYKTALQERKSWKAKSKSWERLTPAQKEANPNAEPGDEPPEPEKPGKLGPKPKPPTKRPYPDIPAEKVRFYQIGGRYTTALSEVNRLFGLLATGCEEVDKEFEENPKYRDSGSIRIEDLRRRLMEDGRNAVVLFDALRHSEPLAEDDLDSVTSEDLILRTMQLYKDVGENTKRETVVLYHRLDRGELEATAVGVQYHIDVYEHGANEPVRFSLRAAQTYMFAAQAVYTGEHKLPDQLKQNADRLNACITKLLRSQLLDKDRETATTTRKNVQKMLAEMGQALLMAPLPNWGPSPANATNGGGRGKGITLTRVLPQVLVTSRSAVPHLEPVPNVRVEFERTIEAEVAQTVSDQVATALSGAAEATTRPLVNSVSRTTIAAAVAAGASYVPSIALNQIWGFTGLQTIADFTLWLLFPNAKATMDSAVQTFRAASLGVVGLSFLRNRLLASGYWNRRITYNDDTEVEVSPAEPLYDEKKDPMDFRRWELRALRYARRDPYGTALELAKKARSAMYTVLGEGKKRGTSFLDIYAAGSNNEARFRFLERWEFPDEHAPPPPMATPHAWDAAPNAGATAAIPPVAIVGAVHEAVALRDVPFADAVARVVGSGGRAGARADGLEDPVGTATQASVAVAHGDLSARVLSRREAQASLAQRMLVDNAQAVVDAVDRAAALLVAALGAKVRAEALPRADDAFWRCMPGGDDARYAVRHLITFSVDKSIWRNDDTTQRAAVDAFAAQWRRYARGLQAAGAASAAGAAVGGDPLLEEARSAAASFARMQALTDGVDARALLAIAQTAPRVVAALSRPDRQADGALVALVQRALVEPHKGATRVYPPLHAPGGAPSVAWAARRMDLDAMSALRFGKGDALALAEQLAGLGLGEGPADDADAVQHYYCPVGAALSQRPTGDGFGVHAQARRALAVEALALRARVLQMQLDRAGEEPLATIPVPSVEAVKSRALRGLARHPLVLGLTTAKGGGGVRVSVQLAPEENEGGATASAAAAPGGVPPVGIVAAVHAVAELATAAGTDEAEARARVQTRNLRELMYNADRYAHAVGLASAAGAPRGGNIFVAAPAARHWPALALGLALLDTELGEQHTPAVRAYGPSSTDLADTARARQGLGALEKAARAALDAGHEVVLLSEASLAVALQV